MKTTLFSTAASVVLSSSGFAQDAEIGQESFQKYCAACHGIEARGDGPMASILVQKPANLRTLAALNVKRTAIMGHRNGCDIAQL